MTLLVALKGTDGLVLAADSRGTFGDPRAITAQNDTQQKAHILAPHVAVLTAGAGEVGAMVIDLVRQQVEQRKIDWATPVLNVLRDTARASYSAWFPSVPPIQPLQLLQTGQAAMRPDLAFLVGGYEEGGTARLFGLGSLFDFSPMLHEYGFAVQGVAQYALYLLNRLYQPDRTVQELTALAVYTITETASQDGKVGGPVRVVTVQPGREGSSALAPDVVQQIREQNEARSKALRDSFYERR